MDNNKLRKFSSDEVNEIFAKDTSCEHKYISKSGETAKKAFLKMADGSETVHNEKLGKDLTLDCALVKERKESDGFVTYGATAYNIQISDAGKELGNCTFQLEPRGVHLSFIGLKEDLDSSYQGTGIGSMMLAKLEEFCKQIGAEYIEGRYTPIGKFASSSEAFYKRNGFKFDVDYEDHGRTYIRKEIQRELEQTTEQKNEKNS